MMQFTRTAPVMSRSALKVMALNPAERRELARREAIDNVVRFPKEVKRYGDPAEARKQILADPRLAGRVLRAAALQTIWDWTPGSMGFACFLGAATRGPMARWTDSVQLHYGNDPEKIAWLRDQFAAAPWPINQLPALPPLLDERLGNMPWILLVVVTTFALYGGAVGVAVDQGMERVLDRYNARTTVLRQRADRDGLTRRK